MFFTGAVDYHLYEISPGKLGSVSYATDAINQSEEIRRVVMNDLFIDYGTPSDIFSFYWTKLQHLLP